MHTTAVILAAPRAIGLGQAGLKSPGAGDLVVQVRHSGISTGTEKLFWQGTMPPLPGMGYPLVPGYESFGEVVEAGSDTGFRTGETVFVPGANCYEDVRGLFGGAAQTLITPAARVSRLDAATGPTGALLALAATARHAIAGFNTRLPELIVGHGTLGRLLARLAVAAGGPAPVVWELNPARRDGTKGYTCIDPADDPKRDYRTIYDATGAKDMLNTLVMRLAKGGEIVLAGFYTDPLNFAFPPAFMKEARFRIAAEWQPDDLTATRALIESGALSLDGLITHRRAAVDAVAAYETAFDDPDCLKMILDWSAVA